MSTLEQQYVAESLQSMTKYHGSRYKTTQNAGSVTSSSSSCSSGATNIDSTSTSNSASNNASVNSNVGGSKRKVKSRTGANTTHASPNKPHHQW